MAPLTLMSTENACFSGYSDLAKVGNLLQCPLHLEIMLVLLACLLKLNGRFSGWQDPKIDILRLEVVWIGGDQVMNQRSNGRGARRNQQGLRRSSSRGINTSYETSCDAFHVAFHSRDLPCKKNVWISPGL